MSVPLIIKLLTLNGLLTKRRFALNVGMVLGVIYIQFDLGTDLYTTFIHAYLLLRSKIKQLFLFRRSL